VPFSFLCPSRCSNHQIWQVGAIKYREMIKAGQTSIPPPTLLDSAESFCIPSRDVGRVIPCRMLKPEPGVAITGVMMHMHMGGWAIGSEDGQDLVLKKIADNNSLAVISIGYRLAPENPFPAGPNDCFDAAEWLVDNAKSTFGAKFTFMGGESAGAHLSVLTVLYLLRSPKYCSFKLKGLFLHYGCYDLSGAPSVYSFRPSRTLLIDEAVIKIHLADFCPSMSMEDLKNAHVSPLYADLAGLQLPPALFTVGTYDPLLDDTVFMSSKWMMGGAETVVKVYPGASHAYLPFPEDHYPAAKQVFQDIKQFVRAKMM
jgi:acetyl esterase/lipase